MRKVLIYGAGEAGVMVLNEIKKHPEENIEVLGFFDDDKKKIGKNIFIRAQKGTLQKYEVLDVETSSSIIGKKNIFILITKDAADSDFKIGLSIYIENDK